MQVFRKQIFLTLIASATIIGAYQNCQNPQSTTAAPQPSLVSGSGLFSGPVTPPGSPPDGGTPVNPPGPTSWCFSVDFLESGGGHGGPQLLAEAQSVDQVLGVASSACLDNYFIGAMYASQVAYSTDAQAFEAASGYVPKFNCVPNRESLLTQYTASGAQIYSIIKFNIGSVQHHIVFIQGMGDPSNPAASPVCIDGIGQYQGGGPFNGGVLGSAYPYGGTANLQLNVDGTPESFPVPSPNFQGGYIVDGYVRSPTGCVVAALDGTCSGTEPK